MKISLKQKLHDYIKAQPINLDDLHRLCKLWGYKTATAERTLRPSQSPEITEIKTEKGAIIGYKWRGSSELTEQQQSNVQDFFREWGNRPKVEPLKGLF